MMENISETGHISRDISRHAESSHMDHVVT